MLSCQISAPLKINPWQSETLSGSCLRIHVKTTSIKQIKLPNISPTWSSHKNTNPPPCLHLKPRFWLYPLRENHQHPLKISQTPQKATIQISSHGLKQPKKYQHLKHLHLHQSQQKVPRSSCLILRTVHPGVTCHLFQIHLPLMGKRRDLRLRCTDRYKKV